MNENWEVLCLKPVGYEEYLEEPKSLDLETALKLHKEILEEIGTDQDAMELYEELSQTAAKYSYFRSNWSLWDREEKRSKDESRTACHNSLIIKFNMLARYLKMQSKEAAWRDELGYEEDDRYNRKRIGDFGCFIAFVNGINAR